MTDSCWYDEGFRDINSFHKHLMEHIFREMQDFEKAVKSGQLKSFWNVKPIKQSGVSGYVARGQFQLRGEPMLVSKRVIEEEPEPLTDVFEEEMDIKIYMAMPDVDRSDIRLDVADGFIEAKAKNFLKKVKLPAANVDLEKAVATYNNGVLRVTIPKIQKTVESEKKRTIKIE